MECLGCNVDWVGGHAMCVTSLHGIRHHCMVLERSDMECLGCNVDWVGGHAVPQEPAHHGGQQGANGGGGHRQPAEQ